MSAEEEAAKEKRRGELRAKIKRLQGILSSLEALKARLLVLLRRLVELLGSVKIYDLERDGDFVGKCEEQTESLRGVIQSEIEKYDGQVEQLLQQIISAIEKVGADIASAQAELAGI